MLRCLTTKILPALCRLEPTPMSSLRSYAKPAVGGLGKKFKGKVSGVMEKREIPVETDPHKLVTYCCGSNINKEGEDVQLKPDSEYPEWLWNLNLGPPVPLEELDPNTLRYWTRLRTMEKRRKNKLLRLTRLKNP